MLQIREISRQIFLCEKYVVGTHQKCPSEILLMKTHKICYHAENSVSYVYSFAFSWT